MKPALELQLAGADARDGGLARDAFLRRFPTYARADWDAAIAANRLLADGAPLAPDAPARAGMRLAYFPPSEPEPAVDDAYAIVYEDAAIALVNKSGNLPCHPAGRYYDNTLARLLQSRDGFPSALMVNRLDRETSGLVLVAKTPEAASRCGRDLMGGQFSKSYLAITEGAWSLPSPHAATGEIRLERGEIIRKKRVYRAGGTEAEAAAAPAAGQKCETIFNALSATPPAISTAFSLMEARPLTGRPHQIRATLKALGYPIAGDKLYGADETIYARLCADELTARDHERLHRLSRQMLHAWRLGFPHPFTREPLFFEAPPPPDFANFAAAARLQLPPVS